jgi:hypothetical protein
MAGVAQLVEPRIVIPVVVGSSPIVRPSLGPLAQLVEQETLNLLVEGSSPSRPTIPLPAPDAGFLFPQSIQGYACFSISV